MRIQAINTNTNFRGLFTDKTSQNGGNWKMEYQPYSWERNKAGEVGRMANKERVNVYSSILPDNEEVYGKEVTNDGKYSEYSDDIFGTRSYYRNEDGTMRRTIDEKPALNREQSLEVLSKKYDRFLDLKQYENQKLAYDSHGIRDRVEIASKKYDNASSRQIDGFNYGQGFMQKSEGLRMMNAARSDMNLAKVVIKNGADALFNHTEEYQRLTASVFKTYANKEKVTKELNQLKELRESGKLIDISSRTVENPNAPLQAALQNIKAAADKFLCLPHKIISMAEILKQVNPREIEGGYNNEIIRYVETLIKRGV